jgi:hypothetical protein
MLHPVARSATLTACLATRTRWAWTPGGRCGHSGRIASPACALRPKGIPRGCGTGTANEGLPLRGWARKESQLLSRRLVVVPLAAGLHMEIKDGPDGPDGPIQLISYCPKHCTPQPQLSGERAWGEPAAQPAAFQRLCGAWQGRVKLMWPGMPCRATAVSCADGLRGVQAPTPTPPPPAAAW